MKLRMVDLDTWYICTCSTIMSDGCVCTSVAGRNIDLLVYAYCSFMESASEALKLSNSLSGL